MNYKLNTEKTAAVSLDTFWLPVTKDTPAGVKMMVINRYFGVAHVSIFRASDGWTHWHPLPKFKSMDCDI